MVSIRPKPFLSAIVICAFCLAVAAAADAHNIKRGVSWSLPLWQTSGLQHLLRKWGAAPWQRNVPELDSRHVLEHIRKPLQTNTRSPVLLVSGLLGTQLELKLTNKPRVPHYWCAKTVDWTLAWLNLKMLWWTQRACWADNMRLIVDGVNGSSVSHSAEGVQVRAVQHYDAALSVLPGTPSIFTPLIAVLKLIGWKEGTDILTHPYDWRLGPEDWLSPGGTFALLKAQVEAAVRLGGAPVTPLCVSLGCTYIVLFLGHAVDQAWKDKHIRAVVSVSGVYGGAPMAVMAALSGGDGRSPWVAQLMQSMPSVALLAPSPRVLHADMYANTARNTTYTAATLGDLLRDAGAHQAAFTVEALQRFTPAPPPGVTFHCLYSLGLDTLHSFDYATRDFTGLPSRQHMGDGDVTVPAASLAVCGSWAAGQAAPVVQRVYRGLQHVAMLSDPAALGDIIELLL